MANKFVCLCFIVCCIQVSLGLRAIRETSPTAHPGEDLSKQAAEALKTLDTQWTEAYRTKQPAAVHSIVRNGTDNLLCQLNLLVAGLNTKVAASTGDLHKSISSTITKLNDTVAELQKSNPEKSEAKDFQKSLTIVNEEMIKIKKTSDGGKGSHGDLDKIATQAFDGIVKTAQSLQQQIKAAPNKQ